MIIRDFFNYYFKAVDGDVLDMYRNLLPEADDLALAYEEMFGRNDQEAINFLLGFHQVTNKLVQEKRDQAILFNIHDNICFPFFTRYLMNILTPQDFSRVSNQVGSDDIDEIVLRFNQQVELRNWFRQEMGSVLSQEDLFTLNEIIALQNFSSGGEYSFLKFVYPHIRQMKGRVLDAGCGAGFATLVMSQYLKVDSIDACQARLERAMALSGMMKKGDKRTFPRVLKLIEEELGGLIVQCEFPSVEELLSGQSQEVNFYEGSIENLPYGADRFDVINCLDVLEHTYNPGAVIREFNRVLKRGGRVFVTAPTLYGEIEQRIHESIEGTMYPAMLHMHHFDPESLSCLFEAQGFKNVEITPFDFIKYQELQELAANSSCTEIARELEAHPFETEALQLFAVYEKL
jgi:SAM-dependent methyltransferase